MQRISVVGISGAGKTTIGRAIAAALDLPFVELDSIYHQPGWNELPTDEFQDRVRPIIATDAWVIDGNYTSAGIVDLVWAMADTVVWLDVSRSEAMRQVIARTIRRAITREELWNGIREPWSNFFDPRPEKNIVVWTWTRFPHTRAKYEARSSDQQWSHLEFVRLTSSSEADVFVDALRSR